MAGRPKRKAALVLLSEMGIGPVAEKIAEGGTLRVIAQELGISQAALHEFLTAPAHLDHYSRARARRAERLAEETLEIADTATPENAQVARLQVDTRKWVASHLDKQTWGDDRGATVNINIADLHLAALRKPASDVVDAQIVTRDEPDNER
jgi:predicted transcriptional regulator